MRNMSKCVTALNLQGKNMFHNTYTINKSICFHSFDLIIFFYTVVCPNSALKPTSIAKSGKNMRFIHHRQKNGIITACYLVFSDTSHLMQTNEITRFACITWKCSSQRKAKKGMMLKLVHDVFCSLNVSPQKRKKNVHKTHRKFIWHSNILES